MYSTTPSRQHITNGGSNNHCSSNGFFKGLEAFPVFMLKAKTLRLSSGETFEDITIVFTDEGISIISDSRVHQIYHSSILDIVFEDPAAVHFMRGRSLAHWMRDVEEIREILEEFDYEFNEIEDFLKDFSQIAPETDETSKNPYSE
jgi:hypothetical protein